MECPNSSFFWEKENRIINHCDMIELWLMAQLLKTNQMLFNMTVPPHIENEVTVFLIGQLH
jgi:hypothetical protein